MKEYKRQYRQLDDETKQKISNSSRNRPKSDQHKLRISQGMKDYWQKKAITNKCDGITIQAYDKKAEIENKSNKRYILDYYGNPKHLYRLEVRLHYQELKDYFPVNI